MAEKRKEADESGVSEAATQAEVDEFVKVKMAELVLTIGEKGGTKLAEEVAKFYEGRNFRDIMIMGVITLQTVLQHAPPTFRPGILKFISGFLAIDTKAMDKAH